MAVYLFQAKAPNGKFVKGEVNASNEAEARVKIRAQQLMPLKLVPKSGGAAIQSKKTTTQKVGLFADKVKPKELQVFTRQFAVLVGAGVPIVQSIEAMIGPGRSPMLNATLKNILQEVERGKRLFEAMKNHPAAFDRMYVNLVQAGEEGGVLDEVLNRLAIYIEKSVKLKGKIVGALWYPAAIIVVAFIVIAAILVFVIPSFKDLFAESGKELPWLTQFVITLSEGFQEYWYLILGFCFMVPISIKAYYNTPEGRKNIDSLLIEVPVFGPLIQKGAVARFSRTLSTLLAAGVRIIDSLEISASTAGNYVIEHALLKAKDSISRGRTITEPIQNEKFIPDMVGQMIGVGEQTGNLDQMLGKIADFYEDEVENAAETMTSLIEPLLMVVLGGIIAVLVIAMYLPIFGLADAVGG